MGMTPSFVFSQIISHGFGLFLFATLIPLMQADLDFTAWHIATIGALTQLAYLWGALLLGSVGHRIDSRTLLRLSGITTLLLLFTMALISKPLPIMLTLTVLSFSAAITWGAMVDLVGHYGEPGSRATTLSTVASGTAWGYGLNGLIILLLIPLAGWRSAWLLAGMLGAISLLINLRTLQKLDSRHQTSNPTSGQISAPPEMSLQHLLIGTLTQYRIACAFWLLFLVGAATIPFTTWLNLWLTELALPVSLGGYSWTVIGVTGMVSGFVVGKLADHKGHHRAMVLITGLFAIGIIGFRLNPERFIWLAAFGYGVMYFPIWGVLAGWIGNHYSAQTTTKINSLGMVAFGLGGALGNLMAGSIQQTTGSLDGLYNLITITSLMLLAITLWMAIKERRIPANGLQQTPDTAGV